jgi:hypothetical protein
MFNVNIHKGSVIYCNYNNIECTHFSFLKQTFKFEMAMSTKYPY